MHKDFIEINGVSLEISDGGVVGARTVSTFLDSPDIWPLLSDEVKQRVINMRRDILPSELNAIGVFNGILNKIYPKGDGA